MRSAICGRCARQEAIRWPGNGLGRVTHPKPLESLGGPETVADATINLVRERLQVGLRARPPRRTTMTRTGDEPTPALDDGDVRVYLGDCREIAKQLPTGSVDCITTSPPYWGLRNYGHEDQIGLEADPQAWCDDLVALFRELRRVLADHGTFWLNLGDAYSSSGGQRTNGSHDGAVGRADTPAERLMVSKPKDLIGMPWMVAFALRADGWYLRTEIIWAKPNAMPESVTDRPTKSHEQVFLLSKEPRYWYDADALRTPHTTNRVKRERGTDTSMSRAYGGYPQQVSVYHPNGANIRTVWQITPQPYADAHFATYPPELPGRCIQLGCPLRVCTVCGHASERIVDHTPMQIDESDRTLDRGQTRSSGTMITPASTRTIGWTDCGHDAWRRGIVLDPFHGSGTTSLAARNHGRHAVGIEINPEYLAMSARRLQQLSLLSDSQVGFGEPPRTRGHRHMTYTIDPVTGEITTTPDPTSATITAICRALQDLERDRHDLAERVQAIDLERDRLLADALAILHPDTSVTAAGITLTRKPGRRQNRAVNRDALTRLADRLPASLRPYREAKLDAALLTPEQQQAAGPLTKKYPTVAAIQEHARELRADGIEPGDLVIEPPAVDDVVAWSFAIDGEA